MKKMLSLVVIPLIISLTSCDLNPAWLLLLMGNSAPVLNNLVITNSDSSSITLAQPTLSTDGKPTPTVQAYIGINETISVSGSTVSNSTQGPLDVSASGYQFNGLSANMTYKIIVVAQNSNGHSVQQITQSTGSSAPVLNSLSISGTDTSSITLAQPTFSTAGNPSPTVEAYIGFNGTVSVSGSTVSNHLQGPIDVSSGGCQFNGLSAGTDYKIIVIALSNAGYSVQQIVQSTTGIAPFLKNLSISNFDTSTITLAQPTFSTAGNPSPAVQAYIGINGTISVSGSTVSSSLQGPIDVSLGGYQFSGLNTYTTYRIVVVAQNNFGYSVQQIVQSTAGIPPVLKSLTVSSFDAISITIAQPTFSTAGNPSPTVQAYIGLNGTISVSGSTVSSSLQGPIDVSTGGYQFNGLNAGTNYRIIVIALNSTGYSVQQIVQSTAGIAPVLKSLSVSSFDSSSITLAQPTFSTTGNPAPTVQAYIGLNGTITVSGSTVSSFLQGPIDASLGGHQFSGLSTYTTYRIVVVAQNASGFSVQQIVQSTAGIAPVLKSLTVSVFDASSITLAQPTFSTAGNPSPTVQAYIGLNGTISVSGSTVINSLQGPIDVSIGGCHFNGLSADTDYKIIVVALNTIGYSVQQIIQRTGTATGIYAAGFYTPSANTQACYWVNGIRSDLPGTAPSAVTGMVVTESNILLAGMYTLSGSTQACYWIVNSLGSTKFDLPSTQPSTATGIFTTGTSVFIAGNENYSFASITSASSNACYWRINNGGTPTKTALTTGSSIGLATGIFVSPAGDIDIAGAKLASLQIVPGYWKNSSTGWNKVTSSGTVSAAISIFISGSSIYLGGATEYNGSSNSSMRATYWTNGAKTNLEAASSGSYVAGIIVSGSTVYSAGRINSNTACYWVNTSRTNLPGTTNSGANSIFLSGNGDLYAGGFYNGASTSGLLGTSGGTACYWKAPGGTNPQKTDLTGTAPALVSSINVK
jgi:hypothetical protein